MGPELSRAIVGGDWAGMSAGVRQRREYALRRRREIVLESNAARGALMAP